MNECSMIPMFLFRIKFGYGGMDLVPDIRRSIILQKKIFIYFSIIQL